MGRAAPAPQNRPLRSCGCSSQNRGTGADMAKYIREDVGGESVVSTTEGVFHRSDEVGEACGAQAHAIVS